MSATIGKLNLVKNIEDPETKMLNKKANKLFKFGAGISIFSTGVLCGSTLLDLTRIVNVSTKFSLACGLGMFGCIALMLASIPIHKQAEKRALDLQDKEQKIDNKLDKIS